MGPGLILSMGSPMAFMGAGFGPGEMLMVLAAALMLFGAKRLPEIARALGRALETFRRAADEVKNEIMREPPVDFSATPLPSSHDNQNPELRPQSPPLPASETPVPPRNHRTSPDAVEPEEQ